MTVLWHKSDVPPVAVDDLVIAARLWLGEAGRGPVSIAAVSGRRVDVATLVERRIADAWGTDTDRSLAIILRLRCLVAALGCRRFQSRLKAGDETWLVAAAAAAATMRVSAEIGFSPVRLAWAIAAEERAMNAGAMTDVSAA